MKHKILQQQQEREKEKLSRTKDNEAISEINIMIQI